MLRGQNEQERNDKAKCDKRKSIREKRRLGRDERPQLIIIK
jgi:hypothetical protein